MQFSKICDNWCFVRSVSQNNKSMVLYTMQYLQSIFSIYQDIGELVTFWRKRLFVIFGLQAQDCCCSFCPFYHWSMVSSLTVFTVKIVSFQKRWKGLIWIPYLTSLVDLALSRFIATWCQQLILKHENLLYFIITKSTSFPFKLYSSRSKCFGIWSRYSLIMGRALWSQDDRAVRITQLIF